MCLSCVVHAKIIEITPENKYVLPNGYLLEISTVDGEEQWPKGWYGLVRCNGPDFVFPLNLSPANEKERKKAILDLGDSLYGDIGSCYDLISAAKLAGYNPSLKIQTLDNKQYSYLSWIDFSEWLYDHLVSWIDKCSQQNR